MSVSAMEWFSMKHCIPLFLVVYHGQFLGEINLYEMISEKKKVIVFFSRAQTICSWNIVHLSQGPDFMLLHSYGLVEAERSSLGCILRHLLVADLEIAGNSSHQKLK